MLTAHQVNLIGSQNAVLLLDVGVAGDDEGIRFRIVDEIAAGDVDRSLMLVGDERREAGLLRTRGRGE
jgi:hypothetical protein